MTATNRMLLMGWTLALLGILTCQSPARAVKDREYDPHFGSLTTTFLQQQMNGQNRAAEQTALEIERYIDAQDKFAFLWKIYPDGEIKQQRLYEPTKREVIKTLFVLGGDYDALFKRIVYAVDNYRKWYEESEKDDKEEFVTSPVNFVKPEGNWTQWELPADD